MALGAMTTIRFEGANRPTLTAEAAVGTRLLDVCDACEAPVAFSCRDASCGTCIIDVTRGAALLSAVGNDERLVLTRLGAPASRRLACRAAVAGDGGVVVVRCTPAQATP
jgi:2Fe-2S ferredoxin